MDKKQYKQLEQFRKARAGAELLFIETQEATTYQELMNKLNNFVSYINKIANDKNDRANKSVIAFQEYFIHEAGKKRDNEEVVKKAKSKKLAHKTTYKDYIEEYLILRKRGQSCRDIAEYSEKFFKVKVSKTTIAKVLKELGA